MLMRRNWIARFIYDKKHLHKKDDGGYAIKKNAFQPKMAKPETSVNLHKIFKDDIPWRIGRKVRPSEVLIGAGELDRTSLSKFSLHVKRAPVLRHLNLHHANILGWSMQKQELIMQAQKLAAAAKFVPIDEALLVDGVPDNPICPRQFSKVLEFLKGLVKVA